MAEIRSVGVSSIKIGEIEGDGSMSTALAVIGVTYQDSAELMQGDAEVTEVYSEENDDPEEVLEVKGTTTLKWSIMDFQADTLVKVLGGTATGVDPNKVWEAPSTTQKIEKSIEITTRTGDVIKICRARIFAKLNMKLSKKGVALVDIEARVLIPTDGATKPIIIDPS